MKAGPAFVIHAQGDGVGIYEAMKYWVEEQASDMQGRILDPHGGE